MPSKLFPRLLALFLIVPIVELVLLVWLGGVIGFWYTVLLIVVTALAGSWLAHREGLSAWNRFQERMARGEMPGKELTDGFIILTAGALLLTPGVLTDIVGLAGLFPPTRAMVRRLLARRLQSGIASGSVRVFGFGGGRAAPPPPPAQADSPSFGPASDPDVIDVEFEEIERRRPRS